MRALNFKGKLESTTPSGESVTSRHVALFPHLYVSDLLFGLSKWSVTVKKQPGSTQWSTGPHPDDEQSGGGGDAGAGVSSGRTFEWKSDTWGGKRGGGRAGGGGTSTSGSEGDD